MREDLQALLGRVMEATGGDREIDVLLELHVERPTGTGALGMTLAAAIAVYPETLDQVANWWRGVIPSYTASVDAVLALVERMLPGWRFSVGNDYYDREGPCWARVFPSEGQHLGSGNCYASTPALALCAALLTALIAQEPADHG